MSDLNYKLNTRATELLFLQWFIDHSGARWPRGRDRAERCSLRFEQCRHKICASCYLPNAILQAVINLPSGVFKPYSGVGTAACFPKGHTDEERSGSTILPPTASVSTISAQPINANDIPDVLAKWPKREEGPNSYRVPRKKIRENDWSLAAGRYKQ